MTDERLAGSDVLVIESVTVNLHSHLVEQNRNIGNVRDVGLLLQKAIDRAWGTSEVVRFNDDVGGGWIIDLSRWFNGEMLYAQIRTVHSRRTLTAIVEVDEYEDFTKTGRWTSKQAVNPEHYLVDSDVLKEALAIEGKTAPRLPELPKRPMNDELVEHFGKNQDDEKPVLIVYVYSSKGGCVDEKMIRCKRSEAGDHIKRLLSDPEMTEDKIEIWSVMTKPRVTVQF